MTDARDQVRVGVRVPGTSANLGPGFDALGVAVDRHLWVGALERGSDRVTTTGEGADEVPTDDDNLVWSSLVRFCRLHDVDVPDVSLRVHNDLPLERGLGSSSAAIVAGLALGRALTGVRVGDLDLVQLASDVEGHPDNVAPAVLGGYVACSTDADGGLVVRRAQPDPRMGLVVAVPTSRQNTNASRTTVPDRLDRDDVVAQAARAVHVSGAMTGTWPVVPGAVGDRLHEPSRLGVMTDSADLVAAWREAGLQAWLSGAGPTVAALVPRADHDATDRARALVDGSRFRVALLDFDLSGVFVCAPGRCPISGAADCPACPRARL